MDAFEAAGRNENMEALTEVRAREQKSTILRVEMEAIGALPEESPYADRERFPPGYIQELCLREQISTGGWDDDQRRVALEAIRQIGIRGDRLESERAAAEAARPPVPLYVQPPAPHVIKPPAPRKMTIDELPPAPTGRYEVIKGGRANMGAGQMVELRVGKLLSVGSYTRTDLAAMLACGIGLRPEGAADLEQIERVVGTGGARLAVLAVHLGAEVDAQDFLDRLEAAAAQIGLDTWGVANSPAEVVAELDETPTVPDLGTKGARGRGRAKGS